VGVGQKPRTSGPGGGGAWSAGRPWPEDLGGLGDVVLHEGPVPEGQPQADLLERPLGATAGLTAAGPSA